MEYDSFGVGNHGQGGSQQFYRHPHHSHHPHKPLLDRVGAMNLNDRMSNNSSPIPDLTRSDPTYPSSSFGNTSGGFRQGGFQNDNFSRPASKVSNRSHAQPPYLRPNSTNSFRSNGSSFQSNPYRPRRNDGFYPKYSHDGKTNVGSYPVYVYPTSMTASVLNPDMKMYSSQPAYR